VVVDKDGYALFGHRSSKEAKLAPSVTVPDLAQAILRSILDFVAAR